MRLFESCLATCSQLNHTATITFEQTLAHADHGYSGFFNIKSGWLPKLASGQYGAEVVYNGVTCEDPADFSVCDAKSKDGREIHTLTVAPKDIDSVDLKATDGTMSMEYVLGDEKTIYFEDTSFYFGDMKLTESDKDCVLGTNKSGNKLTCYATYELQDWTDDQLNGTVSITGPSDTSGLDPRKGFNLAQYQKDAEAGYYTWTNGNKDGQNAVLEGNNRYELYVTYHYAYYENGDVTAWTVKNAFSYILYTLNGIPVRSLDVIFSGVETNVADYETRRNVVPGSKMSALTLTSDTIGVDSITIDVVNENGKYVAGDLVLQEGATYSLYITVKATEGYSLDRYTKVTSDVTTDYDFRMVTRGNDSMSGWLTFKTVCNHENETDAIKHTCTKCGETGKHIFGDLVRVNANLEQKECVACGYIEKIEAQTLTSLTLDAPKVLAIGGEVPNLSNSFSELKSENVVKTHSYSWYYYGKEAPSAAGLTTTEITKLENVQSGDKLKEGYYVVTNRVELSESYRFAAYHSLLLPTEGSSTLKVDGKSELMSDDQKILYCAKYVKVYPEVEISLTLPELKSGMNLAEYSKQILSSMTYNKTLANYSIVITVYSNEKKVTDAYGTAVYSASESQWEYLDGALLAGKTVAAKDSYVFCSGNSYDVRMLFYPLDETGGIAEMAVDFNITGGNEVSATYSADLYGSTIKAIYSLDKTIRMVEVQTENLKMGGDVNQKLGVTASENVVVRSESQWLVWDAEAGEYKETDGKANCGHLYRKTVVLSTENKYDTYEFAPDVRVILNGVGLKVDTEYSNTSECFWSTSRWLVVYIYSDYRHELEFVKTISKASCTVDGVDRYQCSVCGEVVDYVTEASGHNLVTIPSLQATCVHTGVRMNYRYCLDCEQYFDSTELRTVSKAEVFTPVDTSNHICVPYEYEYQITEKTHVKVCPYCYTSDGIDEEEAHHFMAVYDESGEIVMGAYVCDVCGYMYGDIPQPIALEITSNPSDVTTMQGATVVFDVSARGEGLTYQWQCRDAKSTTWKGMPGETAAYLQIIVSTDPLWDGRSFRCIVGDGEGHAVVSEAATLHLVDSFKVTSNPSDVSITSGKTAKFSVVAVGNGLTYQWEKSLNNGKSWGNCKSTTATTATLSVGATSSTNGYLFRCVVKDINGNEITTETAKLTVKMKTAIEKQPEEKISVTVGEIAAFKITASGTGLKYQWEKSKDGGKTWSNCSSTGYATNTMTLTAKISFNGWMFRCKVSDYEGTTVCSDAATLVVTEGAPVIKQQPENKIAKLGTSVSFYVQATGKNLQYQWKKYIASSDSFEPIKVKSATTDTLTFTTATSHNGMRIICEITDANGKMVTTNEVTLVVLTDTSDEDKKIQPQSRAVAVGETVTFTASAGTTGYTYQWEKSTDGGTTWVNSGSTGAKTETITMVAKISFNGLQFRCKMTAKDGTFTYSNPAMLTVTAATAAGPVITSQPADVTAPTMTNVSFSVEAKGDGLTYQWMKSTNGGTTWVNSGSTGAKTATLSMSTRVSYNGMKLKCVVTDKNGKTVTSNAATLTVK